MPIKTPDVASVLQLLLKPLQALVLFTLVLVSSAWIVLFGGESLAGYTPGLQAQRRATLSSR